MIKRRASGFAVAIVGVLGFIGAMPRVASAQFWHALPPITTDKSVNANFSQDEKNVFYLSKENGVTNVWKVPIKGGAPVQVTKFTDQGIVRAFHLINRPEIIYMRATDAAGKDFHIYRIADDGSGTPVDLTPGGPGISAQIIGASYNGKYIYFTSNKVSHDKYDTYRYDTQQYITELIFPNDKDYQVLAWSRDHGRLLMEDPSTGELLMFDINTTDRKPIVKPASGHFTRAIMDPTNHELIVIDKPNDPTTNKMLDLSSNTWKEIRELNTDAWKAVRDGELTWVDYSPNGKYMIVENGSKWVVEELPSGTPLALPPGAQPISIAPKETMLLYVTPSADGSEKLFVYDIGKKTSQELATIKQ